MLKTLPGKYYQHRSGLLLPGEKRPTCIDFFAGCGGLSLGMMMGGFEVVAGVEWEEAAALTYMINLGTYPINMHYSTPEDEERLNGYLEKEIKRQKPGEDNVYRMLLPGTGWIAGEPNMPGVSHFFFGDVRKFTGQQILDAISMKKGEIDCVAGGPPCQGFSTAGRREVMDPRNSLVFDFARLILEIWPKTFIFENVPGILSMVTPEGIPVVDAFCRVLSDGGFGTMNALKKSLLISSGAGAALKGKTVRNAKRPGKDEYKQASLF
ncbi:MAG: DNA cytosine methyltransferase [Peptococcaceae bacterium]|nr:DNA cytosine methyltransferase [Candidatus Syntrophopropionicum ammoniitolerans]